MKSLGVLLVSASSCISGYGVLRLIGLSDGRYGPGIDWQTAHLAGLTGMVLFVPVVLELGQLLPRGGWRTGGVAVTLIGLAASIVQFGADIAFGALAADKAEMSRLSHQFKEIPGVEFLVYAGAPPLFFLGMVALTVLLTRAGLLRWWSPAVMLVSGLLPLLTLDLLPVTGLGMLAALAPLIAPTRLARTR
ncbi:hypothetical protein [Nocardia sp. NPDC052566]|uniref:hypothetical protein n=1 Tax=Nocardia sp. NPDC052566 TaxID=3364330 RepID=UPI0037C9156D